MAFIIIKKTTKSLSAIMTDNETQLESNEIIEKNSIISLLHFIPPTNAMVFIDNDTRFVYNILLSDWINNTTIN